MSHEVWREYAVTWTEQQDLAGRFGLTVDEVRSKLLELASAMNLGEWKPQKSATKTKRVIQAYFESSNATERQGASANGPEWAAPVYTGQS